MKTKKLGNGKQEILKALCLSSLAAAAVVMIVKGFPVIRAYADARAASEAAVKIVVKVLETLCIILGAFFLLFGIVKTCIAHASEQNNEQTSALKMAGAGLVLVILGTTVLGTLQEEVTNLITDAIDSMG